MAMATAITLEMIVYISSLCMVAVAAQTGSQGSCVVNSVLMNLAETAFTASSEWKEDRHPSQVVIGRKGWCPTDQINADSHVYLEIAFPSLVNISSMELSDVQFNGINYNVEKLQLDYQRDEGSSAWLRYIDGNSEQLIAKSTNWLYDFSPPILARRLRFIPISDGQVDICVVLQLYGCYYSGGLISYDMPMPHSQFDDEKYDSPRRSDTYLQKGVGSLTDGIVGKYTEFDYADITKSKTTNWVGWSGSAQQWRAVNITFKFDSLRIFTECRLYMMKMASIHALAAPSVSFVFTRPNAVDQELSLNSSLANVESPRWFVYKFKEQKVANEVKISLNFGSSSNEWLLLSEVLFHSSAIEELTSTTARILTSTAKVVPTTLANVGRTTLAAEVQMRERTTTTTSTSTTTTKQVINRRTTKKWRPTSTHSPTHVTSEPLTLENLLQTASSTTVNSTFSLKQTASHSDSLLLPIILGIVAGFIAVCAVVLVVLARKYCCNAKQYRYWSASHSSRGSKSKSSRVSRAETGEENNGVPLIHGGAKPTIITNPLNMAGTNEKLHANGLGDSQRLMLMQSMTPNGHQNGVPLFNLGNATMQTPKIALSSGLGIGAHMRLESSDYVSLPENEESRSVTTRTNSIVAVPLNMSQNASVVSADLGVASSRLAQTPSPFTNFSTVNMNGMMLLVPNLNTSATAGGSSSSNNLPAARPHLLFSMNPNANDNNANVFQAPLALTPHSPSYDATYSGTSRQNEQLVSMTMNRNTRKRRHHQHPQYRTHRRSSHGASAVRSTCSSLSNQSASGPNANSTWLPEGAHAGHKFTFSAHPASPLPDVSSNFIPAGENVKNNADLLLNTDDRFRMQSVFGSSRLRFCDDLKTERKRESLRISSLARMRLENLKFVEKIGQGSFGEIFLCEMRCTGTDQDSAVSNVSNSTSNNASGESGRSSVSMPHSDCANQCNRHCIAMLLRSALTGSLSNSSMRNYEKLELDDQIGQLSRLNDANLARLSHVVADDDANFDTRLGLVLELGSKSSLFDLFREATANGWMNTNSRRSHLSFTVHIAMQIASGMKYLEALNIVHGDLAARNCLITDNCTVKISNLAMGENAFETHYYSLNMGNMQCAKVALRWMSCEALFLGRLTTHADVWSFAVTLWELLTGCAELPYADMSDDQVIENLSVMRSNLENEAHLNLNLTLSSRHSHSHSQANNKRSSACSEEVRSGDEAGRYKRMPCPLNCPREIYDLMCECWNGHESSRPSFREIHLFLQRKCIGYDPKDDMRVLFNQSTS